MLLNTTIDGRESLSGEKMIANSKLLRPLMIALFAVAGLPVCLWAQGPGGPEDFGPAPETKPAAKPPKPRKKFTIQLPDQYRSKDTDHDGQIGLYEWPRSDYAGFQKLDVNGDGFLTPHELVIGPSKRKVGGSSGGDSRFVRRGPGGGTPARSPAADEPVVISTSNVEAERFFDLLDKDKNGKITEEEFKKSLSVPKKFSDAGIALSFPVGKDEFVRQYPKPAK